MNTIAVNFGHETEIYEECSKFEAMQCSKCIVVLDNRIPTFYKKRKNKEALALCQ